MNAKEKMTKEIARLHAALAASKQDLNAAEDARDDAETRLLAAISRAECAEAMLNIVRRGEYQ